MKYLKLFTSLLIGVLIIACDNNKEEVETTIRDFFSAVKSQDEALMTELYPDFGNLQGYYFSDSIIVHKIEKLTNKEYQVELTNKYTNGRGKTTETLMTFFTRPSDSNAPNKGYIIYDTKGFVNNKENYTYRFAQKKGYLRQARLTDQQIAQELKRIDTILIQDIRKLLDYLEKNVVVDNWNWEKGYGNTASGRGIIKNNTKYKISDLKYTINFYKKDGSKVTQDTGNIYSGLPPYGMESFSFYTTYVGNATQASIELHFDSEFLVETTIESDLE